MRSTMRNGYKILSRKPDGKGPLGRPSHRWEDSIKMDFREVEWEDVDGIRVVQGQGPVAGSSEHGILNVRIV